MVVRIVAIEDAAAPGERSARPGRYRLLLEADGTQQEFVYHVELPSGGGHSVSWEPAQSFLSNERVPLMVVAAITDTAIRFHRGEPVVLPAVVEPRPVGPDTAVIRV
jgi:hypothetical protein